MTSDGRINWVDTAKAIGMMLVFYGHFVERIMETGSNTAFVQFRFIYSFHMPLFFLLSGFFWTDRGKSFETEFWRLFFRRLGPVFFFGIVSLPFWVGEFLLTGSPSLYDIKWRTLSYIRGAPALNWMTWFLVCLFTTEMLAYGILSRIERSLRYGLVSLSFLLLGLFLCDSIWTTEKLLGLEKNTWFVHEALVAFGFYSLGYLLFPYFENLHELKIYTRAVFAALFLGLAAWTGHLNDPVDRFAVFLIGSSHGFKLPFLVTAILGSLGVVVASSLIPGNSLFRAVGRNTVILMGLNGLFHNFVNKRVASLYAPMDGHLAIFIYAFGVMLISILACLPVIYILNRWVPQLVGKGSQHGPILPDLEAVDWRGLLGRLTRVDAKYNNRQGG